MEKTGFDMDWQMVQDAEIIAELIAKFVVGAMNSAEVLQLQQWTSVSDQNRELFSKLTVPAALLQGQIFFRAHTANVRNRRNLLARIKERAGIPKLQKEPPFLHWLLRLAAGAF